MLLCTSLRAAPLDQLRDWLRDTTSASADFAQVVRDRSGRKLQETRGAMQFARPGHIRWAYREPYEQLIVADGERLWIYDKDLAQVTVRPLGDALGSSPAALLAGSNDLDRDFILTELPARDGLAWVQAVPRARDSTFERVLIGLGPKGLEAMELYDSFGQFTAIRFGNIERNPQLPADAFRFSPPPGADVIGER